jgi:hypothetical protein
VKAPARAARTDAPVGRKTLGIYTGCAQTSGPLQLREAQDDIKAKRERVCDDMLLCIT